MGVIVNDYDSPHHQVGMVVPEAEDALLEAPVRESDPGQWVHLCATYNVNSWAFEGEKANDVTYSADLFTATKKSNSPDVNIIYGTKVRPVYCGLRVLTPHLTCSPYDSNTLG